MRKAPEKARIKQEPKATLLIPINTQAAGTRRRLFAIRNYAKNRAASTEWLCIVKLFGSGNGHWPLFYKILKKQRKNAMRVRLYKWR